MQKIIAQKIITVFIFYIFLTSASFSLNISSSVKDNQITLIIDGKHYERTNLSFFVFKDGIQIIGTKRNNVILPYYYVILYNETGTYEFRIIDQKGGYASKTLNLTVASSPIIETYKEEKVEEESAGPAIIIGIIGLFVIIIISLSFIKYISSNK